MANDDDFEQTVRSADCVITAGESAGKVAWALVDQATALNHLGRFERALVVGDDAWARVCGDPELDDMEVGIGSAALRVRAYTLHRLGRKGVASAVLDELVRRYEADRRLEQRRRLANVLRMRIDMLVDDGRASEALALSKSLLTRLNGGDDGGLRKIAAQALYRQSQIAYDLGRFADAITAGEQVVDDYSDVRPARDPDLAFDALWALALDYFAAERYEDSIGVCDRLIAELQHAEVGMSARRTADAMRQKAMGFWYLKDSVGLLDAVDNLERLFLDDSDPRARGVALQGLIDKTVWLLRVDDDVDGAITAINGLLERYAAEPDEAVLRPIGDELVRVSGIFLQGRAPILENPLQIPAMIVQAARERMGRPPQIVEQVPRRLSRLSGALSRNATWTAAAVRRRRVAQTVRIADVLISPAWMRPISLTSIGRWSAHGYIAPVLWGSSGISAPRRAPMTQSKKWANRRSQRSSIPPPRTSVAAPTPW